MLQAQRSEDSESDKLTKIRGGGPKSVFSSIAGDAVDFKVRREFKNRDIFYGLSVDAPDATVAFLSKLKGVKNVWPNFIVEVPRTPGYEKPEKKKITQKKKSKSKSSKASVVHINGTSNVNAPHEMTGVDKLHKLGKRGKGMKIGIIDSGIDYTHPSLGGGFGSGFKVAGGYDFVGDDFRAGLDPQEDEDPLSLCSGGEHGTHVAGIIAAEDPEDVGFGIVGVVPEAEIYSYRVFSCIGYGTWDIIYDAVQRAADDGVDVINMSLGAMQFFELAKPVFENMEKKGIPVIVSAGNDGERGPYHPSHPATDKHGFGIGSINNVVLPTVYEGVDNNGDKIAYVKTTPIDPALKEMHLFLADDGPGNFVECSDERFKKAKDAFPDPSKVIAVASPKTFCAATLSQFLETYGFSVGMIGTGSIKDSTLYPEGWYPWEEADLPSESFKKVQAGIEKYGEKYVWDVSDGSVRDVEQVQGGLMSYFSSYSPTAEFTMRPYMSAPGQNILSTWPTTTGIGYSINSGTSMAAPLTAGCFALLKNEFPSLKPIEILQLLQSTSTPVQEYQEDGGLTTTAQQGAGLINVYNAYKAYKETTFSHTDFNLRAASEPSPQNVTIENRSDKSKTYSISHKGALLVNTFARIFQDVLVTERFSWVENNSPDYASTSFSSSKLTIGAGESANLEIKFKAPDADGGAMPVYGGFIQIDDGSLKYSLPYMGIPYDIDDVDTLDFSDILKNDYGDVTPVPAAPIPPQPLIYQMQTRKRNVDIETYTFLSDEQNPDLPAFVWTIRQPSAYYRVDLIDPDTKFKPTEYGFDPDNKPKTNPPTHDALDNFLGVPTYGEIVSFVGTDFAAPGGVFQQNIDELSFGPYGVTVSYWATPEVGDAKLQKQTVPNADYRVLIRVLRPGYKSDDKDGYQSWLGPVIRVNAS